MLALAAAGTACAEPPSICIPPPEQAAACVVFAATDTADAFDLDIAACQITGQVVEIMQTRTGALQSLTTDAAGQPDHLPRFTVAPGDRFELRYGTTGCLLSICAVFQAAGPAGECL